MGCNCEGKKYSISMGCCVPVLGPIENYYTKYEIDEMLEEIESAITSGCCITPEEVDEKISAATSGLQETLIAGDNIIISGNVISASGCDCDLSDYYTKEEVDAKIPSLSGYATEQWVEDKHYLTEHQPLKTINGQVISGTGNITISGDTDLSDYYTKEEVDAKIPSLSGYATEQWVEDQHYLTEHQPLKTINGQVISGVGNIEIECESGITSGEVQTMIDNSISGKQDTLIAGNNITISGNVISASGCDLSDYYTTEEIDLILNDMATKTWVLNQNYATYNQFIQYVTNLQNQIDSLRAQISGCCGSSGETQYRWITMTGTNDYWCDGTDKKTLEKEQSSTDGFNWIDTGNIRSGSTVLEYDSQDCGYMPTNMKLHATYSTHDVLDIECDGQILKQFEPQHGGSPYIGNMLTAEIGGCAWMIDYTAFAPATNLREVVIDEGVEIIAQKSFSNCQKISALTIPNSVTSIGSEAFYQCSGITDLSIGSGVTKIGINTFSGCSKINNDLNLPNIERVDTAAFMGCRNLHSVTLGSGCTRVDNGAFSGCSSLTSITIEATTAAYIGSKAFDGSTCPIYVPQETLEAYRTGYPSRDYADRYQAIP